MVSLHPKMIVLIPGFFCPKMIVRLLAGYKVRLKVNLFRTKPSISRSFLTPQLPRGILELLWFFILRIILTTIWAMVGKP